MNNIYLRPIGLLYGQAGSIAVSERQAGRIAGGPIAFSLVEVIERNAHLVKRSICQFSDISCSTDKIVQDRLGSIRRLRPDICGLRMDQPRIMGILNVTPDSFSDGGLYFDHHKAIEAGRRLFEEGADIIDVGGESTRPGAEDISLEIELERVLPVIESLNAHGCLISIDTRRTGVMDRAIQSGAEIVNDVSALTFEPESVEVVRQYHKPVILMHSLGAPQTMQNNPIYQDVALDIFDNLDTCIQKTTRTGLDKSKIVADPGIGFGKTAKHNLELLENVSIFHGLGVPLLLGVSRKSFIGKITGVTDPRERLPGSLAGLLIGVQQGIQFFRVHDVAASRQALQIWSNTVNGYEQSEKK